MSFWNLNDGTKAASTTEFESGGGDFEPIPNNTGCIAAIEEAKWDSYEDDEFISMKWRVMQPAEYANRVIFQKIKVFGTSKDKDPKATADKAKRMLAAIDANAGGKLMQVQGKPEDQDLMVALSGKIMAIKLQIWEFNDKKGNWVSAVAPSKGAQNKQPVRQPAAPETTDMDDSIPF